MSSLVKHQSKRKRGLFDKKKKSSKQRTRKYQSPQGFAFTQVGNKGPLPQNQKVTFTYYEYISLSPGAAGVPAEYVFSANGIYDPNVTAAGHQPRGFDQLMALYDHFTVIGSSINITASNKDSTGAQLIGVYVSDNPTTAGVPDDIMEKRVIAYKALAQNSGGPSNGTICMNLNPNTYLGRPNPLSVDTLRGNVSANPSEQVYFILFAMPMAEGVDEDQIHCHVRIEYTAILTEPKQPSIS